MKVVPANFAAAYGSPRAGGRPFLLNVIGGDLRRLYGDVASAPLPDTMAALVARLAEMDGRTRG